MLRVIVKRFWCLDGADLSTTMRAVASDCKSTRKTAFIARRVRSRFASSSKTIARLDYLLRRTSIDDDRIGSDAEHSLDRSRRRVRRTRAFLSFCRKANIFFFLSGFCAAVGLTTLKLNRPEKKEHKSNAILSICVGRTTCTARRFRCVRTDSAD